MLSSTVQPPCENDRAEEPEVYSISRHARVWFPLMTQSILKGLYLPAEFLLLRERQKFHRLQERHRLQELQELLREPSLLPQEHQESHHFPEV